MEGNTIRGFVGPKADASGGGGSLKGELFGFSKLEK